MKALILLLLAPVMMIFSLAGLQTIEWWMETDETFPYSSLILLLIVTIWCVFASRISETDFDNARKKFESWVERLLK